MKKISLYIIDVLVLVFFVAHVSFIWIYSSNGKYTPSSINNLTGRYILPLFHHNWNLFAPDPPVCQLKLLERHTMDVSKTMTSWEIAGKNLFSGTQWFRTSASNKLFRLNESYSRSLMELVAKNTDILSIERSRAYNLALEFTLRTQQKQGFTPTEIQLCITCVPVRTGDQAMDSVFFTVEQINALH